MELNIVFTVLLLIISHHIRIMSYHVPMISPLFFYPQIWWWITIFRNDHFGVPLFSDSSNWMFHYKPSSYWGSLILGACSISHLISHQVFPMVFLMRYGFPMVSLWFSLWFSHLTSGKKKTGHCSNFAVELCESVGAEGHRQQDVGMAPESSVTTLWVTGRTCGANIWRMVDSNG